MREQELNTGELAQLLNCDEKEVQRLLDPKQVTSLQHIEAALATIGQTLVVGVQALATG